MLSLRSLAHCGSGIGHNKYVSFTGPLPAPAPATITRPPPHLLYKRMWARPIPSSRPSRKISTIAIGGIKREYGSHESSPGAGGLTSRFS